MRKFLVLFLLGVLLATAIVTTKIYLAIPDTLGNLGFEKTGGGGMDVFADWVELGTNPVFDETVDVYAGSHALRVVAAGPNAEGYLGQGNTVIPGHRMRLTFWTHGNGTWPGRYAVVDSTHAAYITDGVQYTGVKGTTWKQVTYFFTVPAGSTSVRAAFLPYNAANGALAYFDDISLVDLDEVRE